MGALVNLKNTCDDFSVEFEVLAPVDFTKEMDVRQQRIFEGVASIDEQLSENEKVVAELNANIYKLS